MLILKETLALPGIFGTTVEIIGTNEFFFE